MTTEPRSAKPQPWLRATALELRLYAVALLAMVYVISWRAIGRPDPVAVAAPAPVPAPAREASPYVWLDRLPTAARPSIAVPTGWRLASDAPAAEAPPARIVRVPSRPRVRTRSS